MLSDHEVFYDSEVDPLTQHLSILRLRVDTTRERMDRTNDPEDAIEWVHALAYFRSEELAIHGVDCPNCDGDPEAVIYGVGQASQGVPAEPVVGTCPVCKGEGIVLPDVAESFINQLD